MVNYLGEDDIKELIPFPILLQQYLKEPKIKEFKTEANTLIVRQSYILSWNVENASCIYLNDKKLPPNIKEIEVVPSQVGEVKYELIVENGLYSVSQTLSLNVCNGVVVELQADCCKLRAGKHEKALLSWTVRNAKEAYLLKEADSRRIPMHDKRLVSPENTTTYTIKALALDGITEVSKSLMVEVCPESEVFFNSDKVFTYKDVPVTLTWKTKYAKEVKLDGNSVPNTGSKVITTDSEVTYILSVTDEFETKEVSLTVKTLPLPLIKTVLLPMPKLEQKINFQQRIPLPNILVNTNMQGLNIKMQKMDFDIKTNKLHFVKMKPLHPLSIKVGSSLRSRLGTVIDIITNNVKLLKFVSDEK